MTTFLMRLKHHHVHSWLTRRQLLPLRGQVLSGDIAGAEKGLERINPMFKFSMSVRKVIYTINAIESLNSGYGLLSRYAETGGHSL